MHYYRPIAVEARVIWKLKLYMKPVLRLRSSKSTRHSAQDGVTSSLSGERACTLPERSRSARGNLES